MTELSDFKARLKSGELSGIYIFSGEEDYLIRYYLSELRRAISPDESLAVFNNPVFDGDKPDFGAIAEACKSPPMMSDKKLVEWRHADLASLKEEGLSELEALVEVVEEHPYSVVAFTAEGEKLDMGNQKKPSAFAKRFDKRMSILKFDKSTDSQLYSWLKKHFDAEGVLVTVDTVKALVFRSGHSMDTLVSEVKKLSALAKARGRSEVTVLDVEEVASSTPECDTYAFSNAITERNKQKAYAALNEMRIRRVDPLSIMGMMSRTFNDLLYVSCLYDEGCGAKDIEKIMKLHSYKTGLYISAAKRYGRGALREISERLAGADAAAKYGGIGGYAAIELFVAQYL